MKKSNPVDSQQRRRVSALQRIIGPRVFPRVGVRVSSKDASDIIDLTKLQGAEIIDIQQVKSLTRPNSTVSVQQEPIAPVVGLYKEYDRPGGSGSLNKLILFFNGNNCDITTTLSDMNHIMRYSNCSVLALGYPRYDLSQLVVKNHTKYEGVKWKSNNILVQMQDVLEHAELLLDYLLDVVGLEPDEIIPLGFSIGTGVACYLNKYLYATRQRQFAMTSLHSPFSSLAGLIEEIAANISGLLKAKNFKEALIGGSSDTFEKWNSLKNLKSVKPIPNLLLFHNPSDTTVPMISGSVKIVRELKLQHKNCYIYDETARGDGVKHGLLISSHEIKLFADSCHMLKCDENLEEGGRPFVNELMKKNLYWIALPSDGFKIPSQNRSSQPMCYVPHKTLVSPVMLSDREL